MKMKAINMRAEKKTEEGSSMRMAELRKKVG